METLTTMPLAIDNRAGKPHPQPLCGIASRNEQHASAEEVK